MRKLFAAAAAIGLLVSVGAHPAVAKVSDPSIEVVGGERVKTGELPWVVKLSNGCAGTLIGSRYVLTAAHCTKGAGSRSIVVTAGSEDLGSLDAVKVPSHSVVRAAGFESALQGNDWAVIKLARPLGLPVVELPTGTTLDNGFFTTAGWGATREGSKAQQRLLRKVSVPFVPDSTCGKLYGDEGYGFIASDMICAGDTERGGRDACQGDSGGPLLRQDGDRWVQVGIVSWGVGCGRKAFPGVYTEVSHFVTDIRAAIE